MIINSSIYPQMDITDDVLIDLINSKPLQRLKKVHMSGYNLLAGSFKDSTRYEHSIGVLQLLRLFDASLEEQVAGLIHDIAHTAFSHISTYVLRNEFEGEEFHEVVKDEFIQKTEIPKIITKHNMNLEYVIEPTNFSMLENNLPNICADRLDYALRDGLIWQYLSKDDVTNILKSLTIHKGSFVFNNKKDALTFSECFYNLNQALYGSAYSGYFNHKFGALVKYAMEIGILTKDEWFSDDYNILEKLKASNNEKILKGIEEFNGKLVIYIDNDNPMYTFSKKLKSLIPQS